MKAGKRITIEPVANGWIVRLDSQRMGEMANPKDTRVFTNADKLGNWIKEYYFSEAAKVPAAPPAMLPGR